MKLKIINSSVLLTSKIFSTLISYPFEMMNAHSLQLLWQSFHDVSQTIVLYTLNLHSAVCQSHLNKAKGKKKSLWWISGIRKQFSNMKNHPVKHELVKSAHVCMCVRAKSLSHVQLSKIPWTVAHQAPLSMVFPRQEHWSRLPFPSPGDLLDTGFEPAFLRAPAFAGRFFTASAPCETPFIWIEKREKRLTRASWHL